MADVRIVGIAGGTASGKTTIAQALVERLGGRAVLIAHDNYYRAHNNLSLEQRASLNYDHPDAYETALLVRDLQSLQRGEPIDMPTYDFSQHNRTTETTRVDPHPIVVVEGIMVFVDERLRDVMDLKIFVDADADVRILRRLARDVEERGRNVRSVVEQYLSTVKPMHDAYVEPSKRYADFIISGQGENNVVLEHLVRAITA